MNTTNPYRVTSSRDIYRNRWVHVREDHILRPDGSPGAFTAVDGRPGSSVLALDHAGHAWLVREYKYALGQYSLEVMSGGLEDGESPLEAARRELREESGLTAATWSELGVAHPLTSFVRCPNYLFLARDLSEGAPEPDHGETLEIVKMPLAEAAELVLRNEIVHSTSCVLILRAAIALGLPLTRSSPA